MNISSVQVDAGPDTRTVIVTNSGSDDLVLGGVNILGLGTGAFRTSIDPTTGLLVGAGSTATFTVSFDPIKTGLQTAQLTFDSITDTAGRTVTGVDAPTVSLTEQGEQANPAGSRCTITGSNRNETLRGTSGQDVVCSLGGRDRINGLGANDVLTGGKGNDRITDHNGKDKLLGQRGRDTLNSRDHHRGDILKGGPRKDKVIKDNRDRREASSVKVLATRSPIAGVHVIPALSLTFLSTIYTNQPIACSSEPIRVPGALANTAPTTSSASGSNWFPEPRFSCLMAPSWLSASRYGRSFVMAS